MSGCPRDRINSIPANRLVRIVADGDLRMSHYHALLVTIFRQVHSSSSTFALAGALCPPSRTAVRDYLLKHAEEEKTHYQWILSDLASTGYSGASPLVGFPPSVTQAYISFNFHMAHVSPLARLAIAAFLESLGGAHGKSFATQLCTRLKLRPEQATFFFGHGDTDVGHSRELLEVLDEANPTAEEWALMGSAAQTAFDLYFSMYEAAAQAGSAD